MTAQHDLGEIDPRAPVGQRWRHRGHSWARRSAGGFDSARYQVRPVDETTAKTFVLTHHYAGNTYPAAARRYGLFTGTLLVGVAVFGIPAQARVLTNVFPTLTPYVQSLELSRFVLLGSPGGAATELAPANSESWFLARCFQALAAEGVHAIVAFADPCPRQVGNQILFPGHIGTIYQASSALACGRSTARSLHLLPDGSVLSERALAKVRTEDQGHAYVVRRLVAAGAPTPHAGQALKSWLAPALEAAGAVRLRHRGNLRYAMFTSRYARRHVELGLAVQAYTKQVDRP